jgi:hypothetical protein
VASELRDALRRFDVFTNRRMTYSCPPSYSRYSCTRKRSKPGVPEVRSFSVRATTVEAAGVGRLRRAVHDAVMAGPRHLLRHLQHTPGCGRYSHYRTTLYILYGGSVMEYTGWCQNGVNVRGYRRATCSHPMPPRPPSRPRAAPRRVHLAGSRPRGSRRPRRPRRGQSPWSSTTSPL